MSKVKNEKINIVFSVLFGGYLASLIWLTFISRIGSNTRAWYPLFYSYTELISGNTSYLIFGLKNILLFVPLGFFLSWIRKSNIFIITIIGFCTSLLIECCQWEFRLGEFECDDIMHNTLGTLIGAVLFHICFSVLWKKNIINIHKKRCLVTMLISFVICESLPLIHSYGKHLVMVERASNFDLEDGTKNLLVLNGDSGYVGDSDVYVKYLSDGSIEISGSSDVRAWKVVSSITLMPGEYRISGLSGVKAETVALEIGYRDEENVYHRLAADIGPVEEAGVVVNKKISAYVMVTVYVDSTIEVIATPKLYLTK